jgi:protein-tyrosine phosphatase
VSGTERFVDIHCHILPGLDDGAGSWDDALAMARLAADDGITVVVATPHQLGNFDQNRGDTIRDHVRQFRSLLVEQDIPLEILPGADVRIEPDFIPKIKAGDVLTLADRGRYVLLELPHEMYLPIDHLLEQLRAVGLVGILSHPERNLGLLSKPQIVEGLVESGCLMQVTAGSLVGSFGPEVQSFAESLVSGGLVHFVATDAHGPKSRRPLMRRAHDRLSELAGRRAAYEVCCLNPACVVMGRKIVPGRRPTKARRGGWLRWRKAG